jgi:hypothetical protein
MCGSMLEMSRDAVAAGEEQIASCAAAEQIKYCSICLVTLGPCGDLPLTSWGRWQCLRGDADGLNGCSAACGYGTDYRFGALLGGRRAATCLRLWRALPLRSPTRRWRVLPLAEIVPFHSTPNVSAFNFRVGFQFPCRRGLGEKRGKMPPPVSHHHNADRTI